MKEMLSSYLAHKKTNIEELIDKSYSLDVLRKLYKNYLYQFDNESSLRFDIKGVDYSQQKAQKKELVDVFASVFSSEDRFKKLCSLLPEDVIKVLYLLVWEGGKYRVEYLEKYADTKIIKRNPVINRKSPENRNK